jgi:hypothetical protein
MKFQFSNFKPQKNCKQQGPKYVWGETEETLRSRLPSLSTEKPKVSQLSKEEAILTQRLANMKKIDEEKSRRLAKKIAKELEMEIEKWRKTREEQIKTRRQALEEKKTENLLPLIEPPPAKPKRGLFGFWSRRAQKAREQSQPETAGRRVGG